jgi:hypothetical protein
MIIMVWRGCSMRSIKVCAAMAMIAVSFCAAAASAQTAKPPAQDAMKATQKFDPKDITGIWMQVGGRAFKDYPLTPEYAAILKKRKDDEAAGKPFNIAGDTCLPAGLVGSMTTGAYPIEIFYQTGGKEILFEKEIIGALYHVYLNRAHKSEDDLRPLFYGDSVGHWEGNTLVVDTISLGASQAFDLLTPHSDALHAVQRLTRTAYDTLQDQITVDDAKALQHPISATVTFKLHPDWEIEEYECTNERFVRDSQGYEKIVPSAGSPADK